MRLWFHLLVAMLALPAAPSRADELAELQGIVEQNPSDRNLAWLWTETLEEAGRTAQAERALSHFVSRFGTGHPSAMRRLGRLRYQLGDFAAAVDAFEIASELEPVDGIAHFYRGLALRQLGRHSSAEQALRVAARIEPSLEPEVFLMLGVDHLQRGETRAGEDLLDQVIQLSPQSDSAHQARLLLGGTAVMPAASSTKLSLIADFGIEYDSNVILEGELPIAGSADDVRFTWGAGLMYRALETESSSVTLGYRYGESEHIDKPDFDLFSNTVFFSGQKSLGERTLLRLDSFWSRADLNNDPYFRGYVVRPNLIRSFGPELGATRFYLEAERSNYDEGDILLASLEQSGWSYGLGAEHFLPLKRWSDAWASIHLRLAENQTSAARDLVGFEGAFDARSASLDVRATLPMRLGLQGEFETGYEYARYENRNSVGFLSGDESSPRRDHIARAGLAVTKPVNEHVSVELRWQGVLQFSTLDVYTYDRQIVGVYVRATTN